MVSRVLILRMIDPIDLHMTFTLRFGSEVSLPVSDVDIWLGGLVQVEHTQLWGGGQPSSDGLDLYPQQGATVSETTWH